MLDLKLIDTYIPLIIPAIAAPAVVFYMRQYMKSSFPLDIVEAARIDGSGEFRTFLTIAIPMCKPAICSTGDLRVRTELEQLLYTEYDHHFQ